MASLFGVIIDADPMLPTTWGFRTCNDAEYSGYDASKSAKFTMSYQYGEERWYCAVEEDDCFEPEHLHVCHTGDHRWAQSINIAQHWAGLFGQCGRDYFLSINIPRKCCISSIVVNGKEFEVDPVLFNEDDEAFFVLLAKWDLNDWVWNTAMRPPVATIGPKDDHKSPEALEILSPTCKKTYDEFSSFCTVFCS